MAIAEGATGATPCGNNGGTATRPGTGGIMVAIEVLVFPEEMRGRGEGHYAWDLEPGSMMTNATVSGTVSLSSIDTAIENVSSARSTFGSVQNRLEHTINNLTTLEENLQASESRIKDVDMAKEMVSYTRSQILVQAGTAMLSQANQASGSVLALLR